MAKSKAKTAAKGSERQPELQPWEHAEEKAPTELVDIGVPRDDGKPGLLWRSVRRRIEDSRLWQSLSPDQQRAADAIYLAYRLRTSGVSAKTAALERIDNGHGGEESTAELQQAYRRWHDECNRTAAVGAVGHAVVIKVICVGDSVDRTKRDLRLGYGTAVDLLSEALDLYIEVRGWRRGARGQGMRAAPAAGMPSVAATAQSRLTHSGE